MFDTSGAERFFSRRQSIDSKNHGIESLVRMSGREKGSIPSRTVGRLRVALVAAFRVDGTISIQPNRTLVRIIRR